MNRVVPRSEEKKKTFRNVAAVASLTSLISLGSVITTVAVMSDKSEIQCQQNVTNITCDDCFNGGRCLYSICICVHGYTGDQCEIDVDDCNPNPCQNGGLCQDGANSYTCDCVSGFEGTHCEINTYDCNPNPCMNNALCEDGLNTYTCSCNRGFTGVHCQINIDDCIMNPCQNGGSCVDGVDAYTCNCVDGFVGFHCEIGRPRYVVISVAGLTWQQARDGCVSIAAHLAKIRSAEQHCNVVSLIRASPAFGSGVWFGLNDLETQGNFVYTDGEEVDYTYWHYDEPAHGIGKDCGRLVQNWGYEWDDFTCDSLVQSGYVCEYDNAENTMDD